MTGVACHGTETLVPGDHGSAGGKGCYLLWRQHTLLETVQLLGVLLPYDCELEKQRLRASPTFLSKRGFPLWWQVAALATCRPVITWNKRSGSVTGHARHNDRVHGLIRHSPTLEHRLIYFLTLLS